jgi:hypothetical protein
MFPDSPDALIGRYVDIDIYSTKKLHDSGKEEHPCPTAERVFPDLISEEKTPQYTPVYIHIFTKLSTHSFSNPD